MKRSFNTFRFRLDLDRKIKSLKSNPANGIYYFLGNIPQHITHVMPLYQQIGGTVVVLSQKAADELKPYDIKTLVVDDAPNLFLTIDDKAKNTIEYLNAKAKVVLLYETFVFKGERISAPSIMLSHGVAIKDYWEEWKIKALVENYTYIASLGAHLKDKLTSLGVPKEMFIDVGLARNDLIINRHANFTKSEFIKNLPGYKGQPLICYMPTYWGATSVHDLGLEIINNISSKYYLIFKPHPQTPGNVTAKYSQDISGKNNIYYKPDEEIDMLSMYKYCDVIIGDMSSVVADAILAKKLLIIAYGGGANRQDPSLYWPLREVHATSYSIEAGEGDCVNFVIDETLRKGSPNNQAYKTSSERLFYNLNGDSRRGLIQFMVNKFSL